MAAAHKVDLTDRYLKSLLSNPPASRRPIWDAAQPHFALRPSLKGKLSFYCVKRRKGARQPDWILIGYYPSIGLKDARLAAGKVLADLAEGINPRKLEQERRRSEEEGARQAEAGRFRKVIEQFERTHIAQLRPATARVYRLHLTRTIIPALGEIQIAAIRRRDIIALIVHVFERSGRPTAIAVGKVLHKALAWAVARDLIDSNPASGIAVGELVGRMRPRDRLLSDAELRAVWQAIPHVGPPWSTVYKLLLLTGLRLNEIAGARWKWLDLDAGTLSVPGEVTRNGEPLLVALPPLALELLRTTPHFSGPYIFSANGGFSRLQAASGAKQRLDKALRDMGAEVEPFVVHDFRRTVRSGMGRIAIPMVVAELCLGHKQPGIVGVYDRWSYFDEKREALLRWQGQLLSIVEPPPASDNILPLARTA